MSNPAPTGRTYVSTVEYSGYTLGEWQKQPPGHTSSAVGRWDVIDRNGRVLATEHDEATAKDAARAIRNGGPPRSPAFSAAQAGSQP